MIEESLQQSYVKKDLFYSSLNMEHFTNTDYMHPKRVCKDFEIKYKILIVRDSGFWKNKTITESNKTFLYVKYSYEEKSKVLINKRKITGLKYFNDPKVFI